MKTWNQEKSDICFLGGLSQLFVDESAVSVDLVKEKTSLELDQDKIKSAIKHRNNLLKNLEKKDH